MRKSKGWPTQFTTNKKQILKSILIITKVITIQNLLNPNLKTPN